jgi:hypothetical protein
MNSPLLPENFNIPRSGLIKAAAHMGGTFLQSAFSFDWHYPAGAEYTEQDKRRHQNYND